MSDRALREKMREASALAHQLIERLEAEYAAAAAAGICVRCRRPSASVECTRCRWTMRAWHCWLGTWWWIEDHQWHLVAIAAAGVLVTILFGARVPE